MATKFEFLKMLAPFKDNQVVICMDSSGSWDNIIEVVKDGGQIAIRFGSSSRRFSKLDLIKSLEPFHEDSCVICKRENDGWDNVEELGEIDGMTVIHFGGGSPFSSER
ncbi:hypothetical protein AGENTSMITH_45 [Bacillus phage vB_BspM_AgentSmith]|nr:hypothetical protein AGENTSMITH_45 [Bacillus phage vB_BspM_AgentSmith]